MSDELMPVSKNGRTAMDVALEAARAAGSILRDKFHSEHEVHFKGRSDIVTDVDLAAEKTIIELLNGEFPEFSILAEESKPVDGESPYKWGVDPLDGTRNYAHGIPHFCTIIALAKDDHIVAGLTYDPVREEMFTAIDVALEAALAAGSILRDKFHSEHEVHFKGRSDIVTDVDLAAEKTIIELLNGEFTEFSILAE